MEVEVLKFICANQGAVNYEDLLFNFSAGDEEKLRAVLSNERMFGREHRGQRAKVVARTEAKLCRIKDCQASCGKIHLCKHYLFSGACQYNRRGKCTFGHVLKSLHNVLVLEKHQLDTLERQELCTLLLQNDRALLPQICYDYNHGDGEFGNCQSGNACERMHICQKFLSNSCDCCRVHDFKAPQPHKCLLKKGVHDVLFPSLKSTYANKDILRKIDAQQGKKNPGGFRGRGANRGNKAKNCGREQMLKEGTSLSTDEALEETDCGASAAVNDDTGSEASQRGNARAGRQRGRGRGNRGGMGHRSLTRDGLMKSNLLSNFSTLNICDGHVERDDSAAANDSDTCSESGLMQNERASVRPGRGRGRGNGRARDTRAQSARDKKDICMFFIKGMCIHEDKCYRVHDKMPYRWQIQEGDEWTALPDNESIERNYCDPKMTSSNVSPFVNFDTMTSGDLKVRRLSTLNSVVEKTYILTTEWLWYWEDEFGRWHEYASAVGGHGPADVNSNHLEEKFLEDDTSEVQFTAHSQSYSLSFKDMIQTNVKYGTKKLVRRRPRFVSAVDVEVKKKERRPAGQPTFGAIPPNWDKTQIPEKGYKRIQLSPTSQEYRDVETHFGSTLQFDFIIEKIERIQNKALWIFFNCQKNRMENRSGEKRLFHGTDSKNVDDICHNNFDWRMCGTHGTAYGQGSYFARDARYSDGYTSGSVVKSMFLSRVLVGDYTRGQPEYRKPPPKFESATLYDSCVDQIHNPSIYVIFEKPQIYPEYLISYKKEVSSRKSTVTPKATIVTLPPQRPSTSSLQTSPPTTQPSSAVSASSPYTTLNPPSTSHYYSSNTTSVGASSSSGLPYPLSAHFVRAGSAASSSPTPTKKESCIIS